MIVGRGKLIFCEFVEKKMIETLDIADFVPSADKVIIDVRDVEMYQAGHIAHAINQPIDTLSAELLNETSGTLYVLCGGGTKAERAVALLNELDPARTIVHLTGGTRKAVALGWELEKS